ncbi:ferritin-like domain-domain-containing protein [Leucosporidium creatinivorum]|uniref:Ferritin-like domain-domain-containing protein n=1 Tax=Leucosporidium creatinivorum TaxID=106004 RepID=A0A1Y2FZ55_9BASI|nr:ferritin-like domain-domain-containing protein [Leucosporidium creatinivorum]
MRSVLIALAAAATFASSAIASPSEWQIVKRADGPTDVEILNFALTLEHLEKNFYFQGLKKFKKADFLKAGYSAKTHARVQQIAIQEKAHVTFLAGALGDAGVQQCKYNFDAAFTSVKSFLATSRILENVGTAAYLGAGPDITSKGYLAAAASVLTIEARHSAYLNEVSAGDSGFPVAFEQSLDYAQVYSLAAPFIQPNSCGKAGALPSSIKAFPALSLITKIPRSGHTSAINFVHPAGQSTFYGFFLNGGSSVPVKVITGPDGVDRINVPKDLDGLTYLIISTSATELEDSNTVAGPAILFL